MLLCPSIILLVLYFQWFKENPILIKDFYTEKCIGLNYILRWHVSISLQKKHFLREIFLGLSKNILYFFFTILFEDIFFFVSSSIFLQCLWTRKFLVHINSTPFSFLFLFSPARKMLVFRRFFQNYWVFFLDFCSQVSSDCHIFKPCCRMA